MNQFSLRLALATSLVVGLAGCVIESSGSSGAGVGGGLGDGGGTTASTTASTTATTSSAGGGGVGGGETTTTSSTGGSAPTCLTCAEAITPDLNPDNLPGCEGTSADLLDALAACSCEGACATACGDTLCNASAPADPSAECDACVQDTAAGCGNEFNECSNDF